MPSRSALAAALLGGVLCLTAPAAPAAADQACTVGTTQYVRQPSYNVRSLGIPQTWPVATGRGVTVAVVDSGVDDGNAHLRGAVLPGRSFVPGDTSDGRVDPYGHGTAVAGIIGARPLSSGGSALVGVAPAARILPVRVYISDSPDPQPGEVPPTGARVAQGIRWAADHGADVINVSLSFPPTNISLSQLRGAVDHAWRRGVVVVASAGDTGGASTTAARYPAALDHVVGVAATDAQGVVDDYSIHGPQVDLAAPGANVLVTFHANGDCQTNDTPATSWAAPFVSGLAAQLRERYPHDSPDELVQRMLVTASRGDAAHRDDESGWGLIQPYDALTAALDPRRPGPALAGSKAPTGQAAGDSGRAAPVTRHRDPLAPARSTVLWWVIAATGAAALALVLRPLARSRVRAADQDAGEVVHERVGEPA